MAGVNVVRFHASVQLQSKRAILPRRPPAHTRLEIRHAALAIAVQAQTAWAARIALRLPQSARHRLGMDSMSWNSNLRHYHQSDLVL